MARMLGAHPLVLPSAVEAVFSFEPTPVMQVVMCRSVDPARQRARQPPARVQLETGMSHRVVEDLKNEPGQDHAPRRGYEQQP